MTSCKSARCVFDALGVRVKHVVRRVTVVDGRRQQVGFWIRTWGMVGKRLGVRGLKSRRAPADGDLSSRAQIGIAVPRSAVEGGIVRRSCVVVRPRHACRPH